MRLEGKIALVTGASSGLGKATAERFAKEGAHVIASARRVEIIEEMAKKFTGEVGSIIPLKVDVSKEADILAMYDFALEKFGRVDIVINNAGVADNFNSILDTDMEMWDKIMDTNLKSCFISCKRAIEIFSNQETGGNIVNISSIAGLRGIGGGFSYAVSKWGVTGLTRHIAAIFMDRNTDEKKRYIRCNAIHPCNVRSGMDTAGDYTKMNMDVLNKLSLASGISAGGLPEDVAAAALYLASDEAKYINGASLLVDGGTLAV